MTRGLLWQLIITTVREITDPRHGLDAKQLESQIQLQASILAKNHKLAKDEVLKLLHTATIQHYQGESENLKRRKS